MFVAGIVYFWVWVIKSPDNYQWRNVDFITGLRNMLIWIMNISSKELFGLVFLTVVNIVVPLAFIFNLIGWLKSNNKYIQIGGVLYTLSANIVSAPLCFVEYFDAKHKIKNKPLLYTMLYTLILSVACFLLIAVGNGGFTDMMTGVDGIDLSGSTGGFGSYLLITISLGIISNFIAWKFDKKIFKFITGLIYALGIFTVIPAIICFICFGRHKEPDGIKNELLFYTMLCTLVLGVLCVSLIVSYMFYFIITIGIGIILNFFAWKTNIRKIKLITGIFYGLGVFTVLPAIICFVCFGLHKKQALKHADNSQEESIKYSILPALY